MNLPKSFREIQEERFNNTLFKQDIVWDGESTKAEIEIPVTIQPVLIAIDNVQEQALTVTFEQLIKQTPANATAIIGDPGVATVTITCETPGLEGEKYKIIVVNGKKEGAELSAVLEDDLITVTLATNENGNPDNTKNTAEAVATEIAKINGFSAEVSDDGSGVISAFSDGKPLQFSGGMDDTWAPPCDSEGNELSLGIEGETARVFGPFDYFPRFFGGKITLTAEHTPAKDGLTTVIVQEV